MLFCLKGNELKWRHSVRLQLKVAGYYFIKPYQAYVALPTASLSGGEMFSVRLCLVLGWKFRNA
jgi:hypothetical protein